MDSELLQSFVGQANEEEQEQPSRLYAKQENKEKNKRSESPSSPPSKFGRNRKNVVVIEQRKVRNVALVIDESYCDKDRAASCSFGYLDIKQEFKQKSSMEKNRERIMPDDSDTCAFLMLGKKEIKTGNLESGVKFVTKVKIQCLVEQLK